MTQDELAESYIIKASKRRRVVEVLLEDEAYSDVVCEAQELVELALKGMLRKVGVDPPKWHDVGPILEEQSQLFPEPLRPDLPQLAKVSKWLRKEREFAFDGDIDFIPTEQYGRDDAERALTNVLFVLERTEALFRS
jgi:HEPN domain-containing protein